MILESEERRISLNRQRSRRNTQQPLILESAVLQITLTLFILAFLTVFLLPSVIADPLRNSELYGYDSILLNIHLKNTFNIAPKGGRPSVKSVTADLHWIPQDSYRQTVKELVTTPRATKKNDSYEYQWRYPNKNVLEFKLDSTIRTSSNPLPVKEKVLFPINVPSEIEPYAEPTKLIDIDDAIRKQSLVLASGKDDLFEVVYSVADWVTTNINYNLTTMTAEATQPATWVMTNREGVCDELTVLFISMLRSLGIPARFVSGIAYTNLPEFANPWGGHGWAEVWFPNTGWVPFDVTYGTYGFVDATHVALQKGIDPGESSVDYTMVAQDSTLLTNEVESSVDILDKRNLGKEPFSVKLTPFDNISLDSYNLITATVTNNKDYYVSAGFTISQSQGITLIGHQRRNILLKPHEQKKLFFLLRTNGLSRGFRYEFPVSLVSGFREVARTSFAVKEGATKYDKGFFTSYLEHEDQIPAYNTTLSCTASPKAVYLNDNLTITCNFTNNGRVNLKGLHACLDDCQRIETKPGKSINFETKKVCYKPGVKAVLGKVSNSLVSANALIRYQCIDKAEVTIANLTAPSKLGFDESGEIAFTLYKKSDTIPENLTIIIIHDNFKYSWQEDGLIQPQEFSYTIHGRDLDLSNNKVTVIIKYKDILGKKYITKKTFTINPKDLSLLQKAEIDMMNAQRWIESIFS